MNNQIIKSSLLLSLSAVLCLKSVTSFSSMPGFYIAGAISQPIPIFGNIGIGNSDISDIYGKVEKKWQFTAYPFPSIAAGYQIGDYFSLEANYYSQIISNSLSVSKSVFFSDKPTETEKGTAIFTTWTHLFGASAKLLLPAFTAYSAPIFTFYKIGIAYAYASGSSKSHVHTNLPTNKIDTDQDTSGSVGLGFVLPLSIGISWGSPQMPIELSVTGIVRKDPLLDIALKPMVSVGISYYFG